MDDANPDLNSLTRLAALQASGLLDPAMKPVLDRVTKLVSAVTGAPVALVSLVTADRQLFRGQCGLPEPWNSRAESPLSHSFCQHVVTSDEPLFIEDARRNPLVKANLAIPDIGVIAYAGVPVRDENGQVLGSLCAIDVAPRPWHEADRALLEGLADQIVIDVRLRRQATELTEALRRQREVEADRSQIIRLNVHDLRTPLTALLLSVEVLKLSDSLDDDERGVLAVAQRNGDALRNLVDSLVDIGSIDHRGRAALRPARCTCRELFNAALEQTRPLAVERRIHLDLHVAAWATSVFVDCDKFTRVLVNLIANAIKFTPLDGHVDVHADDDVLEPHVPAVRFTVRDTGIGINSGEEVFREGVILDEKAVTRKSTGLGLAFCKRIVEAHGGKIWFLSKVSAGTTFHCSIPVDFRAN